MKREVWIHKKYNRKYTLVSDNARLKDSNGDWVDCVIYSPLYENQYEMFARKKESFYREFVKDGELEYSMKFQIGDTIKSKHRPSIMYKITGTGINELGEADYICELLNDGKARSMTANKVDENFEKVYEGV